MKLKYGLWLGLAMGPWFSAAAAVPAALSLQGRLADASGNPIKTPTQVDFTLVQGGSVNRSDDGKEIYKERALITPGPDGTYQYLIGSGVPADGAVFHSADFDVAQDIFLQLAIGGTPLLPRLKMSSVSYAFVADEAGLAHMAEAVKAGAITTESIRPGAIGPDLISPNSLTSAQIKPGSITGDSIEKGTLSGALISSGSITGDLIKSGTINGSLIQGRSLTADLVVLNSLTSDQIKPGSITGDSLAKGAVGSAQISSGSITRDLIKPGAIDAGLIQAHALTPDLLVANSLTSDQIKPGSITEDSMAKGAVGSAILALGAVGADQLQAGAVTGPKLSGDIVGALVPTGLIGLFAQSCPAGWTRFSALDGRFPLGASSYSALMGGSAAITGLTTESAGAHSHTVNPHTHGAGTLVADGSANFYNGGAGSNTVWTWNSNPSFPVSGETGPSSPGTDSQGAHTHVIDSDGSWRPPYLAVVFCRKD